MSVPHDLHLHVLDSFAVIQVGVVICGQGDETMPLIADDFCGKVLRYGLLEHQV